jgi:hypothetical protein
MSIKDLRALIRWADTAPDNASFWRRLWCAAEAYDTKTRVNIQALVVNHGLPMGEKD